MQKKNNGMLFKPDEEELTIKATGQRRFRTWYQLPRVRGKFPRVGYGYAAGEEAPTFSQKKKARQFAAQQTLAWLKRSSASDSSPDSHDDETDNEEESGDESGEGGGDDNGIGNGNSSCRNESKAKAKANDDGKSKADHPPPSTQNSPEYKKLKIEDAEVQDGAPIVTSPLWNNQFVKVSLNDIDENDGEEGPSLFKRIEIKCKTMGIDPPRYNISLEAGGWGGRPSFWTDGRMPGDLGLVKNAPNKAKAKVEMAEQVLTWLVTEEQGRRRDVGLMLGDMINALQT
ncbi:hypothetical protein G7Z17_g4924 [Cylindrodendrum hubeiense]|uniref:Uncharacterized protein n=1 Tax=Cylindrodendrum hubeiense TaxID=595255 RepID=A0A9P5L9I9_9HYPO|nr:hypothetical protein G7Z17_g4924 [Cylindrodendrum hubeiense]